MLDGIPFAALGPTGAFIAFALFPYLQLARGKLVPRSALDDEREDKAHWRSVYETECKAHSVTKQQLSKALEASELSVEIVKALPQPPDPRYWGGESRPT